jgi:uncharacterized membrane protein
MMTTFSKKNYQLLIAGTVIVLLGYLLMIGGGSKDPNVFNGEELFSFQRITLAPMVCLAGFVLIIVAVMWRPKSKNEDTDNGNQSK